MTTVKDILEYTDGFSPLSAQCSWDNSGFLIGDVNRQVSKIAFALDLTQQTLSEAVDFGAELMITHHPAIFHPKKALLSGDPAYKAVAAGMAVLSFHTCFDCADGGVNDVLAELLELKNVVKIPSDDCVLPMLRAGEAESETSAAGFAAFAASKLGSPVRLSDCGRPVKKVAVCGGSGMSLIADAAAFGADLFVTGDASHHDFLDALELGISVIAAGHFETEFPAVGALMKKVSSAFPDLDTILIKQINPIEFIG